MLTNLNDQRLSVICPVVTALAWKFIEGCEAAGVAILITQGLRTIAEQDALYQIGRRGRASEKIVTKAPGGMSWHNYGLAFDFVVLDSIGKADWDDTHPSWVKAFEIGKGLGLQWGGDFPGRFKDKPHFEYICGLTIQEAQALNAQGGLPAVWAKIS